ncbi:MAG: hypothetical protein ABI433_09465 [Burkholderiaceae bacterium]
MEEISRPGDWAVPRVLNRFLPEEEQAMKFLDGRIWISTIDTIRQPDNPRGDSGEGGLAWRPDNTATLFPEGSEPEKARALKQYGVAGAENIEFRGIEFRVNHPDAYVLCLTTDPKLKGFGDSRVLIADPQQFLGLVTDAVGEAVGPVTCCFGKVQYEGRLVHQCIPKPLHPLFVGPKGNRIEKEWRMCWIPDSTTPLQPFELHVPEAGRLCSRPRK